MQKIINSVIFIVLFTIFREWFLSRDIIGGDWGHFFNESFINFYLFPPSWVAYANNGLGGPLVTYALDTYLYLVSHVFVYLFGLSWSVVGKIFFFYTFLVLGAISSYLLCRVVFEEYRSNFFFGGICIFLFLANSYVLMMVGGGQMGIALAYAIFPLVLAAYIRLIQAPSFNNSLLSGLSFAACMVLDARVVYLLIFVIAFFYVFMEFIHKFRSLSFLTFLYLLLSGVIALLINAFWIIPLVVYGNNPVNQVLWDYGSAGLFKFLSFAQFSQSISLLHPNWPENIFGKIYFTKPEFMLLAIMAYSSLLFIPSIKIIRIRTLILFFAALGLMGAFLSKGANPPFEQINIFLYQKIPGFGLFRDPTKFYMLTVVSYSILIPFTISKLCEFVKKYMEGKNNISFKNILPIGIVVLVMLYFLFLIKPAIIGQLNGTFSQKQIPQEYVFLKDYIHSDTDFSRIFWIPRQGRFNYFSNIHPAIGADTFFNSSSQSAIVKNFKKSLENHELENLSVKYVIIPYDVYGEVFIKDRKYDETQALFYKNELSNIPQLKKIEGFGKLSVFQLSDHKQHFYMEDGSEVTSIMKSPTEYKITLSNKTKSRLIFAENYSSYWKLRYGHVEMPSTRSKDGFNSFEIIKPLPLQATVYFMQEKGYFYSRLISGIVLFITCIFVVKQILANMLKKISTDYYV